MLRTTGRILALAVLAAGLGWPDAVLAQWKPTRPITIIVPWAAGGSTDQVTRVTAGELEGVLGTKLVIVNQPGASGAIGTKSALEAPKDGYTWTAGAAKDLGTYIVTGLLDTKLQDWHLFLSVANVSVVSVNADAPWKDMKALLDAMKARPGQITVGTAGINSGGHYAMEAVARATGVTYKHVTYDGGNPAVVSTVAGETSVTTQLAVEQADMIRARKLRPLAVVGADPLEIEGYGRIEPITKWVPGFEIDVNYFGIFVPKGVPQEVVDTLGKAWTEVIARSEALKKYATSRGALFAPYWGDDAFRRAWPSVQSNAWLLHEAGKAKVSPDQVGIPKP